MLSRAFSLAAAATVFLLASAAEITTAPSYVEGYVLFADGSWSTVTCNDYQSTYVESNGFARCCTNPSSDCNFVTSCSGVTAFSASTSWACPNDMTCATMTIYESATTDPPALDIFCDAGWEASTIYRNKGISTALGGTLGQGTSTQKTATASPGSLTTAPAASATSTPASSSGDGSADSDNNSGGNRSWIAGAVIGPVAGCAVIFGLGYWFARRRLEAQSQGVYQQQPQSPPGTQSAYTTPQYYEKEAPSHPPPPAELPASSTAELPGS
ncbi:hypothetical protein PHISP_07659 [Aspergillus sp. HF37]|nr:hypothetical protein PHISP_07659 [Aspergillus sp. HF37]